MKIEIRNKISAMMESKQSRNNDPDISKLFVNLVKSLKASYYDSVNVWEEEEVGIQICIIFSIQESLNITLI